MVKDKLFCRFLRRGSARSFELRKEAEEETRGKEWKVKVIERAGIKLAHQVPVGIQLLCSQHQQVDQQSSTPCQQMQSNDLKLFFRSV